MVGLLIAAAGGVFVLVSQGDSAVGGGDVIKEAFVAGVSVQEEQEKEPEEAEEKFVIEVSPQPSVAPATPTQVAPLPVPNPTPEPDLEEPQAIEIEPVFDPLPQEPFLAPSPVSSPQPIGKININTANSGTLQQLSGIGPVLASRIIDYRNNTSLFYVIEDIKKVSGIGDAKFEKMKDEIIVGNVVAPSPSPSPPAPAPTPAPAPEPSPPPPAPSPTPTPSPEKININTADLEELDKITGVGPIIGQKIIKYREANNGFQNIEEIKNVSGIADAKFEKMKNEITI